MPGRSIWYTPIGLGNPYTWYPVYSNAGGVAPPAPDAPPSGGGVTQLLKDTLTGPSETTAAGQARDQDKSQTTEKQGPGQGYKPDLSEVLPSDDAMVYGGEREQQ